MVCDRRGRGAGSERVLRGLSRRRAGPRGARSGDDGGAVALRLRDRGAVVAADRAALRRGRRDAGDLRQPGARITRRSRAFVSATRRRWPSCSARCWRCAREAGLVRVGVIAVDGTKVHANASEHATRDYEQIAREILEDAAAVDAEEDERFGERAATSCRPSWRRGQGRQRWLREAKRRLDERRAAGGAADPGVAARAAEGGQAPPGGGAPGRVPRQRRLRGLPRARGDEGRPPASARTAEALSRRRRRRRARSTSPTPTRATSRRRAAGCRATTPRPSPPSTRS